MTFPDFNKLTSHDTLKQRTKIVGMGARTCCKCEEILPNSSDVHKVSTNSKHSCRYECPHCGFGQNYDP
ncbi:MAG: hypothetical protein ACW964_07265 [Candidatus Hodarchaeales archaeon]|jgi:hypothetical protein